MSCISESKVIHKKRKHSPSTNNFGDDDDDDPYFKSYTDISVHQLMIADEVRTSAYRSAILHSYQQFYGKVVLDVGAGTGILSMFCVHAGAKKVYAVEASSMAEQARLVVVANSMQDRITVIQDKVENVSLPEQVDIIVSEWMGYMLLYESMLTSVLAARDKFLKPGGLMFPESAKLFLAPFTDSDGEHCEESLQFWDSIKDKYKLDMSVLKPYAMECLTHRIHVDSVAGEEVMSRPAEICQLALNSINSSELLNVSSSFSCECYGDTLVHGFVTWFIVFFPDGSSLSTSPCDQTTHWQQSIIYVDKPLSIKQGDTIKGSISIAASSEYRRFLNVTIDYSHNDSEQRTQRCVMDDGM